MRLKWGKEEVKGFSKPIIKVEMKSEWGWWFLFGTLVIMIGMFIVKVMVR